MQRKAKSVGFRLATIDNDDGLNPLDVRITPVGLLNSFRRKDRSTLSHHGVRFYGVLHVTDPALFVETLAAGIGSAKAFGFGLLSVARA